MADRFLPPFKSLDFVQLLSLLKDNLCSALEFFRIQAPLAASEIYEKFDLANRNKAISAGFFLALAYIFLSNLFNIFWFGFWTVAAYSAGFLGKHYLSLVTESGTHFEISDLPLESQKFPIAMELVSIFLVTSLLWFLVGLGMTCWLAVIFQIGYLENHGHIRRE